MPRLIAYSILASKIGFSRRGTMRPSAAPRILNRLADL